MEGGDVCKGKGGTHPRATAARSLRIEFQCEANTEPLPQFEEVSEDNFCEYSFTMQTIHGCPTQCAKTNGKICNDIGKCAWDHDEESVRCACSQDSGLSEEAAVAISGQHDTHFGPYCDQVCPEPCGTQEANHGFCEYDSDLGAARCFCNTGYEGATCSERSSTPAAQAINVPGVTPGAGAAIGVLVPVILIFIVLFGVLLGAMFYLGRHLKNVKLDPNVYRDPATEGGDGTLGHPGAFASPCISLHLPASPCVSVHLPAPRAHSGLSSTTNAPPLPPSHTLTLRHISAFSITITSSCLDRVSTAQRAALGSAATLLRPSSERLPRDS